MANQAYLFIIFILTGVIIGLIFDIFRVLRRTFKTPNLITYVEDILFWLVTGMLILYTIFKFNNGELRAYIFIGMSLGVVLYALAFSHVFIKINVKILTFIKNILEKVLKIILLPINFINNTLLKIVKKFKKKKDLEV